MNKSYMYASVAWYLDEYEACFFIGYARYAWFFIYSSSFVDSALLALAFSISAAYFLMFYAWSYFSVNIKKFIYSSNPRSTWSFVNVWVYVILWSVFAKVYAWVTEKSFVEMVTTTEELN